MEEIRMREIKIDMLNQRVQHLSESIFVQSQINAGSAWILGFIIQYGQENRRPFGVEVVPFQVPSEKELVEFVRLMEMEYNADPGSVSLLAELNGIDSELNGSKFIISVSAEEKCESVTYTVEGEISLTELILQEGAEKAARIIGERQIYPCTIALNEGDPKEKTTWFMPNYRIYVEPSENQEVLEKELCERFDVLEVQQSESGIYLYCYAGEGPYVHCVNDVLWVVSELFYPRIIKLMDEVGVTDYKIEFGIDELY
jgi:hypothetical protein